MKRHIPGLHTESKNAEDFLEGLFLVRVDHVNYRWHPQKPCYLIRFAVLEPEESRSRHISGRLYCTPKALWRLNWFLRDFGYDTDLLGRDEVDEKALVGLKGVVRTSRKTRQRVIQETVEANIGPRYLALPTLRQPQESSSTPYPAPWSPRER